MKRHLAIAVAAISLATPFAAFADDTVAKRDCREECRLLLKNCAEGVKTINDQISQLEKQVNTEADAYTVKELQKLKDKLDDAKLTLKTLQKR